MIMSAATKARTTTSARGVKSVPAASVPRAVTAMANPAASAVRRAVTVSPVGSAPSVANVVRVAKGRKGSVRAVLAVKVAVPLSAASQ